VLTQKRKISWKAAKLFKGDSILCFSLLYDYVASDTLQAVLEYPIYYFESRGNYHPVNISDELLRSTVKCSLCIGISVGSWLSVFRVSNLENTSVTGLIASSEVFFYT